MRNLAVAVVFLATQGIMSALAAESTEPENGPALVTHLQEKYGVGSLLNRERKVYLIAIEDGVNITKAVDRIIQIPTVEVVSFHWERERVHVTRDVIKKLGRLPKLLMLDVRFCDLQDKDAAGLEALRQLRHLRLDGNPITDAALIHLKPLTKLETLHLGSTKVTGVGLRHLQALPRLRQLHMSSTPLTDVGARDIGTIHSLQTLSLSTTPLTDEGLRQLSGLYRLFSLSISDTKVTEAGRKAFLEAQSVARADAEQMEILPHDYPQLEVVGRPTREASK